jgi:Tfp pilus assembly protein PilF
MTHSAQFWIVCPVIVSAALMSGCNQSSGFVMNESGKALYAQGQYTAARREFERALLDHPDSPDYAFNVASAMRKQGDLIGAERTYRLALNLDPRHQPSHHGLAEMYVEQGRVAEAETHLQEWAATQPYLAAAQIENAWLRRRQGDLSGAEQHLRQALQLDPKHPVAMAQLGELYELSGRPDEARAMYQRSLARNPFQAEVKARMADVSPAMGMMPSMSQMVNYGPDWHDMLAHPGESTPMALPHSGAPVVMGTTSAWPAHSFDPSTGTIATGTAHAVPSGLSASGVGYPNWNAMPVPSVAATSLPYEPVRHPRMIPNADPAHVPSVISSAPVVTPF